MKMPGSVPTEVTLLMEGEGVTWKPSAMVELPPPARRPKGRVPA
jgi:hypothetical protein